MAIQEQSRRHLVAELCDLLAKVEPLVGGPLGRNEELAAFVNEIRRALGRMRHLSSQELLTLLGQTTARAHKPVQEDPSKYAHTSLDGVDALLEDARTTRSELLAIASSKFGATIGTLKRLGRDALVERLRGMVRNERSHDAIERLASSEPGKAGPTG